MHDVIKGCIEVLQQGEDCLNFIDNKVYKTVIRPFFVSSSGEHMRHILDHFLVLQNSLQTGVVDYDKRRRGSDIENDRELSILRINEVKQWLLTLDNEILSRALTIKTEVALSETLVVEVASTLSRELVFAASHAVHHYSTIAIVMQMQEINIHKNFGVAPATASYLRSLDSLCAHSPG